MNAASHPVFSHVVGGELPLSPGEARRWLDQPKGVAKSPLLDQACAIYGGRASDAVWLPFGRSALGLALTLAGVGDGATIAAPSYMCEAVFDKLRSGNHSLLHYQLAADLAPDRDELFAAGRRAVAVVTCAYFGSAALEDRLRQAGRRLRALPERPWVIEDRAMAFPAPVGATDAGTRCDFMIYSLRKSYPVPDGAPLVACSERARAALARWRQRADRAPTDDSRRVIRAKVEAKVKRHAWLAGRPVADDPAVNGLSESIASEALISAEEVAGGRDGGAGTAASAAYMLGRDLVRDGEAVHTRARAVVDSLRNIRGAEFPLCDCAGIAVPMLIADRDAFRAAARAEGVFLPAHWPRGKGISVTADVARWYAAEVSLPTMPARPAADVAYMIDRLAAVVTKDVR